VSNQKNEKKTFNVGLWGWCRNEIQCRPDSCMWWLCVLARKR